MKYKIGLSMLAYGLFTTANNAYANEDSEFEVSANAAILSDYVFRGISQTDENFAIQGGFDIAHESGLYIGTWGSNVDYNDGDESSIEIDLYAGYGAEVNGFSYGIGGLYYFYPGANDSLGYDYFEVYGSLGYDCEVASATVSVNYSPDYFGSSGDAIYTRLGVEVPLSDSFTLSGGIGHQEIDDNLAYGVPDYNDWNATLGYDWKKLNFSVAYHDTDLNEPSECASGCDARVVFGVSAEF